jgi:hypothetical protein
MTDIAKYQGMHERGATPEEVYLAAKSDGFQLIDLLRILRQVFNLSLIEAKEVHVVAEGHANTLVEYENRIAEAIEKELSDNITSEK